MLAYTRRDGLSYAIRPTGVNWMRLTNMVLGSVLMLCACAVPLHAQKRRRPSPVLVPGSTAPAVPATSGTPAPSDSTASRIKGHRAPPILVNRPGSTGTQQAVSPQAAHAAAPAAPAFTAGLAMPAYGGESDADRLQYLRTFTTQLDSATALMVGVFRNTSGQPLSGASAPSALSARERERWGRCRDVHFDLQSYAESMHDLVEDLPDQASVQRAGHALDSALTALEATSECDNITSMVTAPERWVPWGSQYTAAARHFYRDWYAQVRDVADRNRAFVMALNSGLAITSRIPVPAALPRTPPYAGAVPR